MQGLAQHPPPASHNFTRITSSLSNNHPLPLSSTLSLLAAFYLSGSAKRSRARLTSCLVSQNQSGPLSANRDLLSDCLLENINYVWKTLPALLCEICPMMIEQLIFGVWAVMNAVLMRWIDSRAVPQADRTLEWFSVRHQGTAAF